METSTRDVLLHPVRFRIVTCVAARPGLTAREIGAILRDVPQATLYRHINALCRAGILTVRAERRAAGPLERSYALAFDTAATAGMDSAQAEAAGVLGGLTAVCTGLGGRSAPSSGEAPQPVPAPERALASPHVLRLSDDELAAFSAELLALVERFRLPPAPGRKTFIFSPLLLPAAVQEDVAPAANRSHHRSEEGAL